MKPVVRWLSWVIVMFAALTPAWAAKRVVVVTNRGCEEVCKAFRAALEREGDVDFVLRDIAGDTSRLPAIVSEIRKLRPDLVATWGTGITLGVVGKADAVDPARHIQDIPVVYMYVGNPVESGVVRSAERSGRPNVAGANIAVPIEAQINLMQAYRPFERVGMVYNTNEPAAVAQAAAARKAFEARGVRVSAVTLDAGANGGAPDPKAIGPALDAVARDKPGFLYYVGSTFSLAYIDALGEGAVARGMPVFTAQEPAYRRGLVQVGLVSPLAGVGQVAAYQAAQILFQGKAPDALPTPTLTRYSVLINMRSARELQIYPPMKLLQFAEVTP